MKVNMLIRFSTEPEFNPADPFAAVKYNVCQQRDSDDNMAIGEKLVRLIEDGSGFWNSLCSYFA